MMTGSGNPALISVLVAKDFELAEKLILQCRNTDYLNAGTKYQVPLTVILSGITGVYNLHLAKLLLENGADANPLLCEKSPLEHSIDLFLQVVNGTVSRCKVFVGLGKDLNPTLLVTKDQVLMLIHLLLFHNAQPVNTSFPGLSEVKFEEIELFARMSVYWLIKVPALQNLSEIASLMVFISMGTYDGVYPLVDCALASRNYREILPFTNDTLVWYAMYDGFPITALCLISHGAEPIMKIPIPFANNMSAMTISPIFAPLLPTSANYKAINNNPHSIICFSVANLNQVFLKSISVVIDNCEIWPFILEEFNTHLLEKTNFPLNRLVHHNIHKEHIIDLMLGNLKSGLQQLCIRTIMQHLLTTTPGIKHILYNDSMSLPDNVMQGVKVYRDLCLKDHWIPIMLLTEDKVNVLVTEHLHLPRTMRFRFDIEAARIQLGAIMYVADLFNNTSTFETVLKILQVGGRRSYTSNSSAN